MALCSVLVACFSQADDAPTSSAAAATLDQIKARGELVVATRNAPTTYYTDKRGQLAGPEYDLASAFAEHLGVDATFVTAESVAGVLSLVESGQADLAAAGLSVTQPRQQRFTFGPTYAQVRQQVVCRQKGKKARSVAQISDVDLVVIEDSSYVDRLDQLAQSHPDLQWESRADVSTEQLLRQVWAQKIDCTVADSNIVDINQRYFPELVVTFNLGEPQAQAWALPDDAQALADAAEQWLGTFKANGGLDHVEETYYGFISEFDFVDKQKLRERVDQRYPKYQPLFAKAAQEHGVPVGLLAAQGYQESHWDPKAKSPTGVRGIMMLTRRTARSLGVDNRLDPAQSIDGGARYLQKMQNRLDPAIEQPDRTYFALAAYNVGLGHLRDAQKLAKQQGSDPHDWTDVRQVLPLLADKRYYTKLKYGYARGTEPVRYVNRIRDYEDVISRHTE